MGIENKGEMGHSMGWRTAVWPDRGPMMMGDVS